MPDSPSVQLTVNDQPRSVPAGWTIRELIAELGFEPGQVAVERNEQLVRRIEHGQVQLQSGDRLEVVTFLGGG